MSNWTLKEKSTGDLEVTVEGEVWAKAVEKAFNKLAQNVTLEGFRKGKAPKALLEKRISAAERQYQAIDDNANEWMRAAMEENNLVPISQPQLNVTSVDANAANLVFTFAVYPEVTVNDYKGLPYHVEEVVVADADVDAEIERMRETYADLETIETEAQNGDTVNIDYEGLKDGVAFDGGTAEGYNLELGSGSFIPGFEEQLVGSKAGEEKELNLTFPEEYHAEELKGAAVVFKVKVNEVKRKVLPELDDDFAADVNMAGVSTVEELKNAIRERQENAKKAEAENAADNALSDALLEKVAADIPDAMIEEEVQQQVQQLSAQLSQYGMSLTSYLQMMGKTADDLKKDYEEQAAKNVKFRLALEKIAALENITPTEEDIEKEFQTIAAQYSMEVDRVKSLIDAELLKNDVRNQKAYEFVKENAAK